MSKKLLSILVVLALALSMIPVVGLPATEANAATTVSNDNLVDADPNTEGMQANCPACGASNVTWTAITAGNRMGAGTDGDKHYYLPTTLNAPDALFAEFANNSGTRCFHLNGSDLNFRGRMIVRPGTTLNVMGNGNVTFLANSSTESSNENGIYVTGTVNIYGGTWKTAEGKTAPIAYAAWVSTVGSNSVNISGNAKMLSQVKVDNNGTATLAQEAEISELYMNQNGYVTIKDGWSGSIANTSTHDKAVTNGAISKFTKEGTITGTVNNLYWNGTAFAYMVAIATVAAGGSPTDATVNAYYPTVAAAVAAYGADAYANNKIIKLFADAELTLTSNIDYCINANGNDVTVKGTGTLHPIDTLNDTAYKLTYGHWDLDEFTGTLDNDVTSGTNRYLTIKEGNAYTAHRVQVEVSRIALKTSAAGIYFKASIYGDETIRARVKAYGVAVKKDEMPTSLNGEGVAYTQFTDSVVHAAEFYSGAVVDILKNDATIDNLDRAQTVLCGRAYITVDFDGNDTTAAELVMGTREHTKCSLASMLTAIDANWDETASKANFTAEEKAAVVAFYNTWKNVGTTNIGSLTLTNISAAAAQ